MAYRAGALRFGDGQSTLDVRVGQQGDISVSCFHGRYYEQAVRENIYFSTCLSKATTLGVATPTTQKGNIIWNPPDSRVNMSMLKWTSQINSNSASTTGMALGIGYQTTFPTSLVAADSSGCTYGLITGSGVNSFAYSGKARPFSEAVFLFAPNNAVILHHNTAAVNGFGMEVIAGDLEGHIVIPPGHIVTMQALGAAAVSHSSTLTWEEIPIV
jgi:hypothetical protein